MVWVKNSIIYIVGRNIIVLFVYSTDTSVGIDSDSSDYFDDWELDPEYVVIIAMGGMLLILAIITIVILCCYTERKG